MKILTYYLGKTILIGWLLSLLWLVGIEFIFDLVAELKKTGTGEYTASRAMVFLLLSLPNQLAVLFPMSALVGTLMGLGSLASHNELLVMRACGWGIKEVIKTVLKVAFFLVLIVSVVTEMWAPSLEKWALMKKAIWLSGGQALPTTQGMWIRDGNAFVHIDALTSATALQGITTYELDEKMALKKAQRAMKATYEAGHWQLHDIVESAFNPQRVHRSQAVDQPWPTSLEPVILEMAQDKHALELSLGELYQAMHYRKKNALDAKPFEFAFWQKIMRPFATLVMMFLAVPFVFGPLRSATFGRRLTLGLAVGFAFYTVSQILGPVCVNYGLAPMVAACLPTVLFLMIGIGLVWCRR